MNSKFYLRRSSFSLFFGLFLNLAFFSLSAQLQPLPIIGSQALEAEKSENIGQHSTPLQTPLLMEISTSTGSTKSK